MKNMHSSAIIVASLIGVFNAVLWICSNVQAGPPLNQELVDLGDNTWLKLSPQPSQRYIPQKQGVPSDVLETSANPMNRMFSGITYGEGKVFFFGGGHNSYPGNDVEIYDVAQNTWIQQFKPEVCTDSSDPCWKLYGGNSVPVITPSGRPWTLHTYQLHTYDPLRKQFIGAYNSGLWAFDLTQKDFIRLHPWPWFDGDKWPGGKNGIHTMVLMYDPRLGQVVFYHSGLNSIYRFDYQTGQWIRVGDGPDSGARDDVHAAYDSHREKHMIVVERHSVWWYDAVAHTWEQITNLPQDVLTTHSLAYDSANKVMVVAGNGGTGQTLDRLWVHDSQGNWTSVTPNGTPPSGGSTARWGTLVYDPTHNVFLLVNQIKQLGESETWAYRYLKAPLVPDTEPPATPTGLQAN